MMTCPECGGKGVIETNRQIFVVNGNPFKVGGMKINIGLNTAVIRYKLYDGFTSFNRAEENVFINKEEAQLKFDEKNQVRKFISLKDIIISDSFSSTIPDPQKIAARVDCYKTNGKFDKEIVVDSNDILIDGYTTYLASKMFNIEQVRVLVA